MGAVVGLILGLGLFLVVRSTAPPAPRQRRGPGVRDRVAEMLAQAGVESVTPGGLVLSCAGVGALVTLAMYVVSSSPVVSGAFGLLASWAPVAVVKLRRRQRRAEL